MSMQAVTIPGLMPVNFIIADCESNWGRWQQLLPLGRSYPIDYLWRDVEEGLPIDIELDARLATLLNSLHHDREKTRTYVLILTDEESLELKTWIERPIVVPEPREGETVRDAFRRSREEFKNGALTRLMNKYKIPQKSIFAFTNSAILLDDKVYQLRFCQRGEWTNYLDQNHTRIERGWVIKEQETVS